MIGTRARKFESIVAPGKPNSVTGVVLTSIFTGQEDPQRHKTVRPTDGYFDNFLASLQALGLHAVVFYDDPGIALIPALRSSNVDMVQSNLPPSFSINDFRFVAMNNSYYRDKS